MSIILFEIKSKGISLGVSEVIMSHEFVSLSKKLEFLKQPKKNARFVKEY
jgi:hypothetical protein